MTVFSAAIDRAKHPPNADSRLHTGNPKGTAATIRSVLVGNKSA